MRELFTNNEFKLHWVGMSLTQIGAYFTLIALPWLTLEVTENDPIELAIVMACFGVPHSIFILIGGVFSDRLTPLTVVRAGRLGFALSTLVFSACLMVWPANIAMLITFAITAGSFSALCFPANQSIIPHIVPNSSILAANVLTMGGNFIIQSFAPVLVGLCLLWAKSFITTLIPGQIEHQHLTFAFLVDAMLVLVAAACSLMMRPQKRSTDSDSKLLNKLHQAIIDSFKYTFGHPNLSLIVSYLMLISILIYGPLVIFIPYLAKVHLATNEAGLSYLFASQGIGTFIGAMLVIILKPKMRYLGMYILVLDLLAAVAFICLGFQSSQITLCILLMILGCTTGFAIVAGTTWYQLHVPMNKLSSAIGIVLFAVHGLVPISSITLGTLLDIVDINTATSILGGLAAAACLIGLSLQRVRNMGQVNDQGEPETLAYERTSNGKVC
ncbi:MFS transporter [Pseudoalteromonas sp. S16_S37]|uniref:MFS transporter n=1 Tax=Pseudoalteromonas sp. S16_S37 TaxID=2720228 RepID=UPI0016807B21|nr:MFS transporter [Pseudoalteromonas sp. S16_S37]MBD1582914.1 MFS transporter [Pseudoalteromonas sp. S16_S37]